MAEDTSQPDSTEDALEEEPKDAKAKFRDALAKKAGNAGGPGGGPHGASKVGSEHGAAKSSRQFRRKSGG
ncbi:MAG: DUF5302 domain-containing protein [Sporichthyaceae bacterium]